MVELWIAEWQEVIVRKAGGRAFCLALRHDFDG